MIARRLARSHLTQSAANVVDAVRDVALIQAQVLSAGTIGACIRTRNATKRDVERALYDERTLVKTWTIRGTLHLVPADELTLWSAAVNVPEPPLHDAVVRALDDACLTRAELAESIGDESLRSPWGDVLGPLAQRGVICFGPPRGANVTFVRVDQWLGRQRTLDPDEARREVLRRYLRVYGPAKPADFQRWSAFGPEARRLFDEAELQEVRVEGTRAWLLAGDDDGFDADPSSVQLLPQYDAYVIGFRPREQLLAARVNERVKQDPKGKFESVTGVPTLVVDGVVTGLWRREGNRVDVERILPLPRGRRRELDGAVTRIREIVG